MNKLNEMRKKWYQEDLVVKAIFPLAISAMAIFLLVYLKHHGII